MEGEKRIPLEIFDELAGVRELPQPDKEKKKDDIVIIPKLTLIYYAFLKENTKIFFSLIFKDFSKGLLDYFAYMQSLSSQPHELELTPVKDRTDANLEQQVQDLSDITELIKLIPFAFAIQYMNLMRLRATVKNVGGSIVDSIVETFLKLKEEFLNFFQFGKKELPDDSDDTKLTLPQMLNLRRFEGDSQNIGRVGH